MQLACRPFADQPTPANNQSTGHSAPDTRAKLLTPGTPASSIPSALQRAHAVAAPPYDVVSRVEACDVAMDNPHSFLRVSRAEIELPIEIDAYIDGKIIEVIDDEGIILESNGTLIQGIIGVGGEKNGELIFSDEDSIEYNGKIYSI